MSSVIIGATSVQQLEENMISGSGWKLSTDEASILLQVKIVLIVSAG